MTAWRALTEWKAGDKIEVEAFNLEGDKLVVMELLRKAGEGREKAGAEGRKRRD